MNRPDHEPAWLKRPSGQHAARRALGGALPLVLALATCFTAACVERVVSEPVALDEFAHVPAGLSHWELGRYYLYRENPP